MVDKLVQVLRAPGKDEEFMKWLTVGIYNGKRTANVMTRMGDIAKEAVEPALLRVMGDEFIEKLKERISSARDLNTEQSVDMMIEAEPTDTTQDAITDDANAVISRCSITTTQLELDFYEIVKTLCVRAGYESEQILLRDTTMYCNVSFGRPTKWFVRFFCDTRRLNITTLLPVEQAQEAAPDFVVEESPSVFGNSRIYFDDLDQLWKLEVLLLKSLALLSAPVS
jgi:predicted type IV restriction endonuclease